jgi:hypothetical protein
MSTRVEASPPCNDIAMLIPSGDSSALTRVFGNSLDLMSMDMTCARKGFLDAKAHGDQQRTDPDSKLLDLRWLDVIAS